MTDNEDAAGAEARDPGTESCTTSEATQAWADVVSALDELGSAVTMWAKAVRDDPVTRRRAMELQEKLERYGKQIGDAAGAAARSDFARQVGSAAMAAGDVAADTAKRVGDDIAPKIAGAVRAVSENIRRVAESTQERSEAEETVSPAPASSDAPNDYVP